MAAIVHVCTLVNVGKTIIKLVEIEKCRGFLLLQLIVLLLPILHCITLEFSPESWRPTELLAQDSDGGSDGNSTHTLDLGTTSCDQLDQHHKPAQPSNCCQHKAYNCWVSGIHCIFPE